MLVLICLYNEIYFCFNLWVSPPPSDSPAEEGSSDDRAIRMLSIRGGTLLIPTGRVGYMGRLSLVRTRQGDVKYKSRENSIV